MLCTQKVFLHHHIAPRPHLAVAASPHRTCTYAVIKVKSVVQSRPAPLMQVPSSCKNEVGICRYRDRPKAPRHHFLQNPGTRFAYILSNPPLTSSSIHPTSPEWHAAPLPIATANLCTTSLPPASVDSISLHPNTSLRTSCVHDEYCSDFPNIAFWPTVARPAVVAKKTIICPVLLLCRLCQYLYKRMPTFNVYVISSTHAIRSWFLCHGLVDRVCRPGRLDDGQVCGLSAATPRYRLHVSLLGRGASWNTC